MIPVHDHVCLGKTLSCGFNDWISIKLDGIFHAFVCVAKVFPRRLETVLLYSAMCRRAEHIMDETLRRHIGTLNGAGGNQGGFEEDTWYRSRHTCTRVLATKDIDSRLASITTTLPLSHDVLDSKT